MNTKLKLSLDVPTVNSTDVVKLLKLLDELINPRVGIVLICENGRSAGQVAGAIREKIGNDTQFEIEKPSGKNHVEINLPPIKSQEVEDDQEQAPPTETKLTEGDFKVRLLNSRRVDGFGGKTYLDITMEVCEGPFVKTQIQDKVLAFPQNARTEHLARALGIPASDIQSQIGKCKSKEFLNRRREQLREDGSSFISNYYFPLIKAAQSVAAIR